MEYKDYYKILGVERNASQKDVQRAYRRLARRHHPDVNPGDEQAEERFKEVNEAYEVLRDPEKRPKYDQLGAQWRDWRRRGRDPSGFDWGQWATPPGGRVHVEYGDLGDILGRMGTGGRGFSEFFEAIFGGAFAEQGRQTQASRRGADLEHPVVVTLQEALQGAKRILELDGRRLEVTIPPGVDTNSRVRMSGLGAAGRAGGPAGDLYLRLRVAPDPRFQRRGDDLITQVEMPLHVAMLGGEAPVETLQGPTIMLKIPPQTQPGKIFRLRGKGMPRLRAPQQRGDLVVKTNVELPEKLSARERELFEELRRLREGAG